MTRAAVQRLETKDGLPVDGKVGGREWATLRCHVVMAPEVASAAGEPKHDYRRVSFRGAVMNVRTRDMLVRAETYAKQMGVRVPVFVVQGSFSHSVSASGGTHDGGGALDIRTRDRSLTEVKNLVKAMRMAGFAAWKRGYGDRQLSSAARNQVAEYFRGGDGLIGSVPDGDASVGRPWPKWASKYR